MVMRPGKRRRLQIVWLLIGALFLSACGLGPGDQDSGGDVLLADPFGEELSRWSMLHAFGAKLPITKGSLPFERWTSTGTGEVSPIAEGRVVQVGAEELDNNQRSYVVVEHSGSFRIPSSTGPHLSAAAEIRHTDNIASNDALPMVAGGQLFTNQRLDSFSFDDEAGYVIGEERVTKLFSVYRNLESVSVRVNQRVVPETLLGVSGSDSVSGARRCLWLELRHPRIERADKSAAFDPVLGPSGDGSFEDPQIMVDIGYLEPTTVIQANLDEEWYETFGDTKETETYATDDDGELIIVTGETSTAEPGEPGEVPRQNISEAEATELQQFLYNLSEYSWVGGPATIPDFAEPGALDKNWLLHRFINETVVASADWYVTLDEINWFVQAKLGAAYTIPVELDFNSMIERADWDPALGQFEIAEYWAPDNRDHIATIVVDAGMRDGVYEVDAYHLRFITMAADKGAAPRDYGLLSIDNFLVGCYDSPHFAMTTESNGTRLITDVAGLGQATYRLSRGEDGSLNLLSKQTNSLEIEPDENLRSMDSLVISSGMVSGTDGQKLRVRSLPRQNAPEIGQLAPGAPVTLVGPAWDGYVLAFDETGVAGDEGISYVTAGFIAEVFTGAGTAGDG